MSKKKSKAKSKSPTRKQLEDTIVDQENTIKQLQTSNGNLGTERAVLADALFDLLRDRIMQEVQERIDDSVDDAASEVRFGYGGY